MKRSVFEPVSGYTYSHPTSLFDVDDWRRDATDAGQSNQTGDEPPPSDVPFLLVTADEQRVFERNDRRAGLPGTAKRSKKTDDAEVQRQKNVHQSGQPFDMDRKEEESRFKEKLNEILPDIAKSRAFAVNQEKTNQLIYGTSQNADIFQPVHYFADPTTRDLYAYLSMPMKKKLMATQAFDAVECILKPIEKQWYKGLAQLPMGCGIDLFKTLNHLEEHTRLTVFSVELSIPSMTDSALPAWMPALMEQYATLPPVAMQSTLGVAIVDTIVDESRLILLRFVYLYAVLSEVMCEEWNMPAFIVREDHFRRTLAEATVPDGETHVILDRSQAMKTAQPQHLLTTLPCFIYAGRYYLAPMSLEKYLPMETDSKLKAHGLLWNLMPLFDEYDKNKKSKT